MKESSSPSVSAAIVIRPATLADLPDINRIYNHYVGHSTATFALVPESEESRLKWFQAHEETKHPILTMLEEEQVIGWASLSTYNSRCAYDQTVELSIYLDSTRIGKGYGDKLFKELMDVARRRSYHAVLSIVCSENDASIKLMERHGFEKVGEIKEVGRKFDRWLDVTFLERIFSD